MFHFIRLIKFHLNVLAGPTVGGRHLRGHRFPLNMDPISDIRAGWEVCGSAGSMLGAVGLTNAYISNRSSQLKGATIFETVNIKNIWDFVFKKMFDFTAHETLLMCTWVKVHHCWI